VRFRAVNDDDDGRRGKRRFEERRAVRPSSERGARGGGEIRVKNPSSCAHARAFESKRKRVMTLSATILRHAQSECVVFPREARGSSIAYRIVYLTYQHILQTAASRRTKFASIRRCRERAMIRVLRRDQRLVLARFRFFLSFFLSCVFFRRFLRKERGYRVGGVPLSLTGQRTDHRSTPLEELSLIND